MKKWYWAGGIVLLLVGIYAALFAAIRANNRAVQAELQAHYDDYARAVNSRDVNAILRYYDRTMLPTWTARTLQGRVISLPEQKRSMKEMGKTIREVDRVEVVVDHVSVIGPSAVSAQTFASSTVFVDPKGRPYRETVRNSLRSFWTDTPQGWKCGRTVDVGDDVHSHWLHEKKPRLSTLHPKSTP